MVTRNDVAVNARHGRIDPKKDGANAPVATDDRVLRIVLADVAADADVEAVEAVRSIARKRQDAKASVPGHLWFRSSFPF